MRYNPGGYQGVPNQREFRAAATGRPLQWARSDRPAALVGPEESNPRNSEPMFLNPLPHLLTRPCPFEWMGVQPIVLRPGLPHVIDELGSTVPRSSLQVVVTECADQQLRFVEPRGVDR